MSTPGAWRQQQQSYSHTHTHKPALTYTNQTTYTYHSDIWKVKGHWSCVCVCLCTYRHWFFRGAKTQCMSFQQFKSSMRILNSQQTPHKSLISRLTCFSCFSIRYWRANLLFLFMHLFIYLFEKILHRIVFFFFLIVWMQSDLTACCLRSRTLFPTRISHSSSPECLNWC